MSLLDEIKQKNQDSLFEEIKTEIPPEPPITEWSQIPQYFKETAGNIPQSAYQTGKALIIPFTKSHAEVARQLSETGKNYFEILIDTFKQRYGSLKKFIKTFHDDPVGVMMDTSIVFTSLEPFKLFFQPIKKLSQGAGVLLKEGLGATTSTGTKGMEIAYSGGKEFRQAMRSQIDHSEIISAVEEGFSKIRFNRGMAYKQKLQNISQMTSEIDISPIRDHLEKLLQTYNIKRVDGKLDFSRATLDRKAIYPMKQLIIKVDSWGTQSGDLTPLGLDRLKRTIDDYFMPTNNSRAFTTSLRNAVKNTLVKTVPEYQIMVADYEKLTNILNDMRNSLSISKGNADLVLKKLTTAIKYDKDFARILINELDKVSEGNLMQTIAGYTFKPWIAPGAYGKIVTGVSALAALGTLDPRLATILMTGSPRIIGEFTNALGRATHFYTQSNINKYFRWGRQGLYQVGRIEESAKSKGGGGEDYRKTPNSVIFGLFNTLNK